MVSNERSSIPVSVKRMSMNASFTFPTLKNTKRNSFLPRPTCSIATATSATLAATAHLRRPSAQSFTSGNKDNVPTPTTLCSTPRTSHTASEECLPLTPDVSGAGAAEYDYNWEDNNDNAELDPIRAPTKSSLNKRRGRSSISSMDLRTIPKRTSSSSSALTLGSVDDYCDTATITNTTGASTSRIPRATATVTHAASSSLSTTPSTHSTHSSHSSHHSNYSSASGSTMNRSPVLASTSSFSAGTPTRRSTLDHHSHGHPHTDTISPMASDRPSSVATSRFNGGSPTSSSPLSSPYTPTASYQPSPHTPSPLVQARRDLRPSPTGGGSKTSTGRIIEGLQNELETTKAQLERARNEVRNCRREIGSLTRKTDDLCETRDHMRAETDALSNVISRKERTATEALARARAAESAVAQHVSERKEVEEQAKRNVAEATATADAAIASKHKAVSEAEALRDSVASLREVWTRDVRSLRAEADRLSAQMQSEREEAARRREHLVDLIDSQASEHQSVVALVQEVTSNHSAAAMLFQQELSALRMEVDRSSQEAEDARQLARDLAAELVRLRSEASQPGGPDLEAIAAGIDGSETPAMNGSGTRSMNDHSSTAPSTSASAYRGRPRARSSIVAATSVLYDDRPASARASMLLPAFTAAVSEQIDRASEVQRRASQADLDAETETDAQPPFTDSNPSTATYPEFPEQVFQADFGTYTFGPKSVSQSFPTSPTSPVFGDRPLSPDSEYDDSSEYEFEYDGVSVTIGSPAAAFDELSQSTAEGDADDGVEKVMDAGFIDEVGREFEIELELEPEPEPRQFALELEHVPHAPAAHTVEEQGQEPFIRASASPKATPARIDFVSEPEMEATEATPKPTRTYIPADVPDVPEPASPLDAAMVPIPATPPKDTVAMAAGVPIPATPPTDCAMLIAARVPIPATPPTEHPLLSRPTSRDETSDDVPPVRTPPLSPHSPRGAKRSGVPVQMQALAAQVAAEAASAAQVLQAAVATPLPE